MSSSFITLLYNIKYDSTDDICYVEIDRDSATNLTDNIGLSITNQGILEDEDDNVYTSSRISLENVTPIVRREIDLKLNDINATCKNKIPVPFLLDIVPSQIPTELTNGITNFNAENQDKTTRVTIPFCNSRTDDVFDSIQIFNLIPFQGGQDTQVAEVRQVGTDPCNQFQLRQKNTSVYKPFEILEEEDSF